MVRQSFVQAIANEPADRDVDLRFSHQLAVVDNSEQQVCEHQANRDLRIDPGPAVVRAIAVRDFLTQPAEVENTVHARQDVIRGHQLLDEPVMNNSI